MYLFDVDITAALEKPLDKTIFLVSKQNC